MNYKYLNYSLLKFCIHLIVKFVSREQQYFLGLAHIVFSFQLTLFIARYKIIKEVIEII